MVALFHAQGVRKTFGEFVAINDVDMMLEKGVLTSIIGPNGAGKTTLINLFTGKLPCDSGRLVFDGTDITGLTPHQRVHLGISRSFQVTNILQQMTVAQNLQLPVLARLGRAGRPFARPDRDPDVRADVESLLSDIGLAKARDVRAKALPHGDQRLLEIGMAIACRPRLCFLDEPCSGMNPGERAQVQELIRKLTKLRDVTFVIIEHDMDVVFALSDRVIVMHQGKVLTEGKPEAIRNHAGVKEIYLGEEVGD
jgi:branched-chain amino acid transport system ATP-binding protein